MPIWFYPDDFEDKIQLNHLYREGVWTHQCPRCFAEWPAERPGQPNPAWWRCPNGCNASALDGDFARGYES